jgi:hypothetical protein
MTTQNRLANVAVRDQIAAALEAGLLETREKHLKHAPRDEYVHQNRRDIARGRARPGFMIVGQLMEDIADGVPVAIAFRPLLDLRAALEAWQESSAPRGAKTLRALLLNEARAEGRRNLAEIELSHNPENAELLRRFQEASAAYEAANRELCDDVGRRRAVVELAYPQTARHEAHLAGSAV